MELCWHKVENQVVYPDTANPTTRLHRSSRLANWSQKRCRTPKGKQWKGELRWHKVENPSGVSRHLYQDTANPTLNVHCRSRSANLSQLGVEPEKGSQLHDTQRKTASAPGKKAEQPHQKRLSKSLPHTQQEERKTQHRLHRKEETPHTYTGTTRDWGPQLKHTRLATVGEREAENKQMEQKRLHQKRSLGIG